MDPLQDRDRTFPDNARLVIDQTLHQLCDDTVGAIVPLSVVVVLSAVPHLPFTGKRELLYVEQALGNHDPQVRVRPVLVVTKFDHHHIVHKLLLLVRDHVPPPGNIEHSEPGLGLF